MFASCTSNLWENVRLPKMHKTLPRLILNPQDPLQNQNLEIVPIDIVVQFFTHENIAGSHSCNECMISILPNVCHKLVSILWLIEQLCSLTIDCLVYRFEPDTSISRQFESRLLVNLQLIPVLPSWNGDHPSKEWRLCTTAPLSCLPMHNISQRIFKHVLPCRRTTPSSLREDFPTLVIFQLLQMDTKLWQTIGKINLRHSSHQRPQARLSCAKYNATVSIGSIQDSNFAGDLETQSLHHEESYVYLEVVHLFLLVGCARSKHQYTTVLQNQRSFRWMLDCEWMDCLRLIHGIQW